MDAQVNCIAHLLISWLRPQIRCFYAPQNDNISLKSPRKHLVCCSLDASNENTQYSKLGNFRENFIFGNSVQRLICDVKKSGTGHDLPTSVNDRVISPIREGLIFMNLCISELRICKVSQKSNSCENFQIYSIIWATLKENLILLYANNQGADQLVCPCSLISAYSLLITFANI